jgi:hypothetical protein
MLRSSKQPVHGPDRIDGLVDDTVKLPSWPPASCPPGPRPPGLLASAASVRAAGCSESGTYSNHFASIRAAGQAESGRI